MTPSQLSESAGEDPPSDHALISRLYAGEANVLGQIYDRYARLVYTLALKMMASSQEAEDLTQEVFVSLWQRQNYDPNRGSLKSYLVTYTRSRALDRLRVRSNRSQILRRFQRTEQIVNNPSLPVDVVSQGEESHQLQKALNQLPETEREVLCIAYFEGYSQPQIAQRLNLPLGTVKTRTRQGLLRLRQLLASNNS